MEIENSNIKVFGNPAGAQPQEPETKETTTDTQPAETQTEKKTEVEPARTQVEKPEQQKPDEQNPAQTSEKPDEQKPEFKVSFWDEKPDVVETPELKDEVVLNYLKKKGFEINTFDELKKPQLPEVLQKAEQFINETGRGLDDFLKAQKDWTKAPKEQAIKEYYKTKYPHLTDEQLNDQVELISVTDEDADELSDTEIKQRKLEFAKIYGEALNFLDEQRKKYFVPKQEAKPKQLSDDEIAKMYQPYWEKRDKSLEKLNEIKIGLNGIGEIKIDIPEKAKKDLANITQTQESFFSRWADENGQINTDLATEDTLWSIKEWRQKMLSDILEQAHVLFMDKFSKKNRNVNLDNDQPDIPRQEQKGRFEVIGKKNNNFFKPVI